MKADKKSSLHKWIIYLIVFTVFITLSRTHIFSNIFSLIIEREYFIPKQSSIFTFKETVRNDGSSDVWRYGEDSNNYYYNLSTLNNDVLYFSKKNVLLCPDFNPENINSWCGAKIPKKTP